MTTFFLLYFENTVIFFFKCLLLKLELLRDFLFEILIHSFPCYLKVYNYKIVWLFGIYLGTFSSGWV